MTKPANTTDDSFRTRWLKAFGLPETGWPSTLRREARQRPFADAPALAKMIGFLFGELPAMMGAASPAQARVGEAFAWLCFQAWQSGSHFPAFAENYAEFLQQGLTAGRLNETHHAVADLLLGDSKANGDCGFQRLVLADPARVREAEGWLQRGQFDAFLRAKVKYDEFDEKLRAPEGFRKDWRKLAAAFPKETSGAQIMHRSLLPERHWVRDGGARFRTRAERFQSAFDLLCWKYCLWGVGRNQPLLLKPSVVFTSHGTQVFIPAYLSFDAKRDLDLGLITKLHRARGIQRQGEGFSVSRSETKRLRERAKAADKEARELGLRGERRYAHIALRINRVDSGDYRATRKLLGRVSQARPAARAPKGKF